MMVGAEPVRTRAAENQHVHVSPKVSRKKRIISGTVLQPHTRNVETLEEMSTSDANSPPL
jgi:hypothetical protein